MRSLLPIVLLLACTSADPVEAELVATLDHAVGDASLPPPTSVTLEAPAFVSTGHPFSLTVPDALESERIYFLVAGAEDPGAGPCPRPLGGCCLDISRPVGFMGTGVADGEGLATLDLVAPPWPGAVQCFQAVIIRGPVGVNSALSNVVCTDFCADVDDDGDGICNTYDTCPTGPDWEDRDDDGICDSGDLCPDTPGEPDADGDTVCDPFDLCAGEDDRIDSDDDGTPDGCDDCPGGDNRDDADGDGIPDACDDVRFVTFDGSVDPPAIHAAVGVDTVTRIGSGDYDITWSTPFPDAGYVVSGSCNLLGSGGAKFGYEGNNLPGDIYEGFYADRMRVGCRDSTNAGVDTDLVHVVATRTDTWVSFDGDDGSITASHNVASVERLSAGHYRLHWDTPFADTHYLVTGGCNLWGSSGAKFGLEGNNIPGDVYEGFFTDRIDIGCRDSENGSRDARLVTVNVTENAPDPSVAAAWVTFDGAGGVAIHDSYNVASVSRNSAGNYTVTFDAPMADTAYAVAGTCQLWNSGGAKFGLEGNNIPGSPYEELFADRFDIGCRDSTNTSADSDLVHVVVYR